MVAMAALPADAALQDELFSPRSVLVHLT